MTVKIPAFKVTLLPEALSHESVTVPPGKHLSPPEVGRDIGLLT
jgi:hypothetical protein